MIMSDVICAIATPPGKGGIGIIRISGKDAIVIADKIFHIAGSNSLLVKKNGTFSYGRIIDNNKIIDSCIALVMHNPNSFTGENTVELQTHGGPIVLKLVLTCIINAGARLAEPGEFSKRAFLNGKIDLTQAEAICDLINAKSDKAASLAIQQLEGSLTISLEYIYDSLLEITANLETTIDFIEDELPDDVFSNIKDLFFKSKLNLQNLLLTWNQGRVLRDGIDVAILGKPNSGKSTLLNSLLGYDRAIVSDIAGTTRDIIEEGIIIDDILVRIKDCAGLRDTNCEIESEGIKRAESLKESSDFIFYIIDGSVEIDKQDLLAIESLPKKTTLIILNKIDKGCCVDIKSGVKISLLHDNINIIKAQFIKLIENNINKIDTNTMISERHKMILEKVNKELILVEELLNNIEENAVVICSHLRNSLDFIGQITGRIYHNDLLENIFSRFCIGK